MKKTIFTTCVMLLTGISLTHATEITLKITKKYLNIPVSHAIERQQMAIEVAGKEVRAFDIRLSGSNPDYWVFCDVSAFNGKTIKILYPGNNEAALSKIYQDDVIAGQDSLYKEQYRPQLHFSSRRGWNNDPNGLIYYEGEYHLFYQHNPYEREWGNMHWGHAVSKNLIHWEELPEALYPDKNGTAFSGTAIIDYDNTAGFAEKNQPAMIAVYTADAPDRQTQCLAYSINKGRTWTKHEGNPVIDSKEKWDSKDTRDPKVFWYVPNNEWVMVLNERDGHSIYTSANLKDWKFESHLTGFWECPELFELPVDGDKFNTKWVMYGASGTYMLGDFNGKEFKPESGKYYYTTGGLYAAQTFANMPESDDRRIQIAWGRIPTPASMPFNMLMLLPTELTLHTTKEGVRMFSNPVKELNQLEGEPQSWSNLSAQQATEKLRTFNPHDCLRIKATLKLSHATDAGLNLNGQSLIRYDLNHTLMNGVFYSPEDRTSMEISADIIIDKTCIEVFIDNGAYSYSMERKINPENKEGFGFFGNNIEIKTLRVCPMRSIWSTN